MRDCQLSRVTLLDFGIARSLWASTVLTRFGDIIGTPRYMAPEQAQGFRDIVPACDVYSLGCILFECLTGKVPIDSEHVAAALTKILFQDAPPLRSLRPDLPEALESLLRRMLAKQPAQRPADADALLAELAALPALPALEEGPAGGSYSRSSRTVAHGEAQLVSVVVADRGMADTLALQDADSLPDGAPQFNRNALRAALSMYSNQVDVLVDGSAVVTLANTHKSSATDQAMLAARCALTLKENWPDAQVVLATGRGIIDEQGPLGEAIDRAFHLLSKHTPLDQTTIDRASLPVILDEVTAGLLDTRFEVEAGPHGSFVLRGELAEFDPARPLLGRPTPCLGRERELGVLEGLLGACRDEATPHVVLVTAPPGLGKSRLRHEFVRRLHGRAERVEVLLGRGDPMSAGSPYGLLGQALRRLCGMVDGESQAVRRAKLTKQVRYHFSDAEVESMVEFLGELCEIPAADSPSVALHAARQDPHLMNDRINQAALDFIKAAGEKGPLLLVLEDLHWGDGLTVRLVDMALRQLRTTPLLVLALARPEVEDLFPRLWADRQRQDLRLDGLKAGPSERLVRQALGEQVAAATVQRILRQAGGNALYLEELIRAEAEGKGEALPETVLAMVQGRLMRLSPGARATLRAASVYGQTFWRGSLASAEVEHWLQVLIDGEFIERHRQSRFPGDPEYGFRHTLMREAAYSFLSSEEQRQWHRHAAQYLERAGEPDPMILAEHWQRGGDGNRALLHYAQAAEQALERNDLTEALHRADRALASGVQGELRGRLYALKTAVLFFRNQVNEALPLGNEALALLPTGSPHWFRVLGYTSMSAAVLGDQAQVQELAQRFGTVPPPAAALGIYTEASSLLVTMLGLLGDRGMAELFLSHLQQVAAPAAQSDPFVSSWLNYALARHANALQPRPGSTVQHLQKCLECSERIGDRRQRALVLGDLGFALARLGAEAEAESKLREGLQLAAQLDEPVTLIWVQMYLALLLAEREDAAAQQEAAQLAGSILRTLGESSYYSGIAHCALAAVHSAAGDTAAAVQSGRKALEVLRPTRSSAPLGHLALARALLLSGQAGAAVTVAAEGITTAESLGGSGGSEVPLRRVHLHALRTSEAPSELALQSAKTALDHQITLRVSDLTDAVQRASYLGRVCRASGPLPVF